MTKLIPLKEWVAKQAIAQGITIDTAYCRLRRGKWLKPAATIIGKRAWVAQDEPLIPIPSLPTRYSHAKRLAEIEGVSVEAIYNRQNRAAMFL